MWCCVEDDVRQGQAGAGRGVRRAACGVRCGATAASGAAGPGRGRGRGWAERRRAARRGRPRAPRRQCSARARRRRAPPAPDPLDSRRRRAAAAAPPASRHGTLHRDRAQVSLPVEHHRHRVPRPGVEGRRVGRGHEGDGPIVSEGSEAQVEEAARQLPGRAQAAERDVGQGPRQPLQEELPLEVYGADAVPAAVHEQQEEAGRLARLPAAARARQRPRPQRRRRRRRGPHLRRVRLRARLRAQAQGLRAAHRHRPQAGLPVQGAEQAPMHRVRPCRPQARLAAARARARTRAAPAAAALRPRPPRHILQQHVPVHQAVPVPHADQDQEDAVQRGDRGGGGAHSGAAELREPVGAGGGLVLQLGGRRGRGGGGQALLSPPRLALPLAVPAVR